VSAAVLAAVVLAAALPAAAASGAEPSPSAMSCPELWRERNLILKRRGFCFTEARAAATFGNAGCSITSEAQVPLTPAERSRMALIVLTESSKRCR
jgi:hypothetical protein